MERGENQVSEARAKDRAAVQQMAETASREQKWSLLRAVYPVNPGIPHYLDFPQE